MQIKFENVLNVKMVSFKMFQWWEALKLKLHWGYSWSVCNRCNNMEGFLISFQIFLMIALIVNQACEPCPFFSDLSLDIKIGEAKSEWENIHLAIRRSHIQFLKAPYWRVLKSKALLMSYSAHHWKKVTPGKVISFSYR